jgi:hypothetical protein
MYEYSRAVFCLSLLGAVFCNESPPTHYFGEFEGGIGFFQAIELVEDSLIFEKQSKYQKIEVFQSKHFGKMLVIDDTVQLTDRDADSYNEMMGHVAMFQHANPKRVLIVGGGDGYVLSEVRSSHSTRSSLSEPHDLCTPHDALLFVPVGTQAR